MQGASIFKKAGHVPPQDVIEQIMTQFPDCHGYAFIHKDGNNLTVVPQTSKADAAAIVAWMEKAKDKDVLFCAYKLGQGEKLEADKLPPYTVLSTTDGKPALVAVLHGDLSDFYRKDSSLPPEYFCVRDDLIDRVKKAYNLANGNMKDLCDELYSNVNKRQIVNLMASEHGAILLFSFTDELLIYAKTEESMVAHDWGLHTMLEEPVPAAQPDPEVVEEDDLEAAIPGGTPTAEPVKEIPRVDTAQPSGKRRQPGDGGSSAPAPSRSNAVASTASTTAVGNAQPTGKVRRPQPGETGTVVPISSRPNGSSTALSTAPTDLGSRKFDPNMMLTITIPPMGIDKKAKWMRKRISGDQLPRNFSDWTEISCKAAEATKAFMQTFSEQNKLQGMEIMAQLGMKKLSTGEVVLEPKKEQHKGSSQEGAKPITNQGRRQPGDATATKSDAGNGAGTAPVASAATAAKDTAPHAVGKVQEAGAIPIIPKTERDSLATYLAKPETKQAVDHHFAFIKDPKNISSLEKKYPTLVEGGYLKHLEDVHGWPPEVFQSIVKEQPVFAANLLFYLALDHMKLFDQITDPNHKVEPTEPQKTPEPEPQPEPVKVAAAGGSRRRQPGEASIRM